MKQIYLDNGATSFPKAPGVGQAMKDYIEKVGVNVNRSSYRATAEAALSTLTVREDLCRLFCAGEDPSYAVFTSGVAMSLNLVMKGALHPGDHLIISGMEHNAVARPATQLEAAGVAVSIAPCDEDGVLHWLGATKGTPEALSAREEANILWLAGDSPLPPSEAEVQADGTLDFTSGPLAHLRDLLEKVNRHDRRATVRVPVGGEDKTITLSYRLNGRQETASNAAAGTPRSVNTADIF